MLETKFNEVQKTLAIIKSEPKLYEETEKGYVCRPKLMDTRNWIKKQC